MTRSCLDMMISRHPLTAIAIPSLRSLQIRVVPPKQTPQIKEFVFYQYNTDSPSDAIAPRYDDISASPSGNRYSVAPLLTNPGGASKTNSSNRGVCFFTNITRIPPVTRLRLDMMISRHALTAIAIPSLRQSIASLPYASLVLTNSNGESKRCCRYLIYKMCKKLLLFSPRLSRI